MQTRRNAVQYAAVLVVAAAFSACGVSDQKAPSLTGPSGFAQSLTLMASPDRLAHDGLAQSVVTVVMHNESGQPLANQRVSVSASTGFISHLDVVTGNDGRATFFVRAPALSTPASSIVVFATPFGTNADNGVTRTLTIDLTGPSNTTAPAPSFTVTPSAPQQEQIVTFDASATTDEGGACNAACTYSWNFGDGSSGGGRIITHTFAATGSYIVELNVVDSTGTAASTQKVVTVAAMTGTPDKPVARFTVSPAQPQVNEAAVFDASSTTAGNRAVITQYSWTFGDGTTAITTSPTVNHTYDEARTYAVVLTVTDNLGQTSTVGQQVVVVP